MENIKKDLIDITQNSVYAKVGGYSRDHEITLFKLNKEIIRMQTIRTKVIETFEMDVLKKIQSMQLPYFKELIYPIIINYKKLFEDDLLSFKIFTDKYMYANCLISKNGLESTDIDFAYLNNIIELIKDDLDGLFRVKQATNLLDNSFYYEVSAMLYYKYLKNITISGNGIKLPSNILDSMDIKEKEELLRFYYNNLRTILKNIKINDSLELDSYRTDLTKRKALQIYRG